MFRKRWLVIIGIAAVFLAWFFFFRNRPAQNGAKIETVEVKLTKLAETVSSSGKTKAVTQVDLKFQTSGRLAWINIKEGDAVKKHQAIAGIDQQELQKNLIKALRDYSKERNDFEEDKRDTYKDKPVTDTIKRILEKNQWDLDKAVIDVELKDITLKWATLTTPIAGIVTHIDTPVAGVNILSTNVITIADPETIIFSANIDETKVGKISEGMAAEVQLDAFPDEIFTGKVAHIAFASETTSGGTTVYPVEISLTDNKRLRLGFNGDASVIVKEVAETKVLPTDAVRETSSGKTKYVIKKSGTQYEKVQVKTGIAGETEIEILEGLSVNDEVVIEGFQLLPKKLQND